MVYPDVSNSVLPSIKMKVLAEKSNSNLLELPSGIINKSELINERN